MADHPNHGDELRTKVAQLITWRSGAKRAPHKPLQLLLAIANAQNGGPRLQPFSEIESKLRAALDTFGPVRKSTHPEYPFWHLRTDQIWEVDSEGQVNMRRGSLNPSAKQLRDRKARGGLLSHYFEALRNSPALQMDLIHDVLDTHFPSSIHEDIINFFGLILKQGEREPSRDVIQFRQHVLAAYDGACAISNFSVRMEDSILGVEATHVLWPQAGGKNSLINAIAMTTLHRKLFHLGVFTIDSNYRVRVSKNARGTNGFNDVVGQFDGKKIGLPSDTGKHPDQDALGWHRDQVFRH
jgi:putative restriction endonuclease